MVILVRAYMRRKQFEARLFANEIMAGLSGGSDTVAPTMPAAPAVPVRVWHGHDGKKYPVQDDPLSFLDHAAGKKPV